MQNITVNLPHLFLFSVTPFIRWKITGIIISMIIEIIELRSSSINLGYHKERNIVDS